MGYQIREKVSGSKAGRETFICSHSFVFIHFIYSLNNYYDKYLADMHVGFNVDKGRCRSYPQKGQSLLGKLCKWCLYTISDTKGNPCRELYLPRLDEVRRDFSEEGTWFLKA